MARKTTGNPFHPIGFDRDTGFVCCLIFHVKYINKYRLQEGFFSPHSYPSPPMIGFLDFVSLVEEAEWQFGFTGHPALSRGWELGQKSGRQGEAVIHY